LGADAAGGAPHVPASRRRRPARVGRVESKPGAVRSRESPHPRRASVTDAVLHPSWPRAAANAIWKPLKAAVPHDAWPLAPTDWRVNDPRGNPGTGGRNTTPGVPGPVPRTEPV